MMPKPEMKVKELSNGMTEKLNLALVMSLGKLSCTC